MGHDLWHFFVADHLYDLLYDLRNDDDLLPFYYFLYDFFDDHFNRFKHLLLCLNISDDFFNDLDHFNLLLYYNLLHFHHHWLLDLHDLLNNHLLGLKLSLLPDFNSHAFLHFRVGDYFFSVGHHFYWFLAV